MEYQYAIADHQGNTRVVFTSATPDSAPRTATFEGNANDNVDQFLNVNVSYVWANGSANHTAGGAGTIRMNQTYKVGPTKSVHVYPGDKVDISVWEYHEGSSGFGTSGTPLNTLVSMVAGAIGGVSGAGGEAGAKFSGVNSAFSAFGTGGNQGDSRPAAYLNYILFDKNYKLLDMGWQLAPATTYTKQQISFPTKDIKEEGYLITWLSYDDDSNNWVYFDDFAVTHTKSNIVQYNEYYPFGLQTSTSWTREGSDNDFLYNAGNELNANNGWYEMHYRGYDPATGRMLQVDPYATMYAAHSTYNYALNNPVIINDPNGGQAMQWQPGMSESGVRRYNMTWDRNNPNLYYNWTESYHFEGGNGGVSSGSSRAIKDKNGNTIGYGFSGSIARFVFGVYMSGLDQGFYSTKDGGVGLGIMFPMLDGIDPNQVTASIGGGDAAQQGILGMSIDFQRDFSSGNSGVEIRLSYKDPFKRFSQYGWIQTIRTNSLHNSEIARGVRENEPFNDGRGDGIFPYYGGPTDFNSEGFDTRMADRPGRLSNSSYVTWRAEVTIGGIQDGVFVPLGTLTYGFDIIDGKLDVYYPRIAEPTPWHIDSFTNKSKW